MPIVPVVASCQKHIKLNRWRNGVVIVQVMDPISTLHMSADDVKQLADSVRAKMVDMYEKITLEAEQLRLKATTA